MDDDSRWVGSGEEDCRTNLDLDSILSYRRRQPRPWALDSGSSIFVGEFRLCRRLKDHGRDRLAFSVSGWRQVSARQKRVHSDSIMFGVSWPTGFGFLAGPL